jgi:hypothetical protein
MSCEWVAKLIPLYFYGELPPEEEERLEEHLHECAACGREMERQRQLAVALDRRRVEAPPALLEECRADLMAAIEGGAPLGVRQPSANGPWTLFLEAMTGAFAGVNRFRRPVGAVALVVLGFFAARFTASNPGGSATAAPSDQVYSTVRSVRADDPNRVEIALDETRRRVVAGRMDDPNIQRLLLAAAHEDNPAVRVIAVDLLKGRAGVGEVRDALLNALATDSNAGVRQKALEGLKPLAADPTVRKILQQALMGDDNPAVRMQAVDLLVAHRDDSMVGVLQGMVQSENNDYVRLRVEKALKDMNASVGTF